jgi:hypothetical protein
MPIGLRWRSKPVLIARGLVALMVGWSLLTDFNAIKRAGVPILRLLNIPFRLKQQARPSGGITVDRIVP